MFTSLVAFLALTTVTAVQASVVGTLYLDSTPDSFGEDIDNPVEELLLECHTNNLTVHTLGINFIKQGRVINLAEYNNTAGLLAVNPDFNITARVAGNLDCLVVEIPHPSPHYEGIYSCYGKGPRTIRTVHRKVHYEPPPIGVIIQQLRIEKRQIDFDLDILVIRLGDLEVAVNFLECKSNLTHALVDSIDEALFEYSEPVNGTQYILSYFTPASFVSAQEFCQSRDGTLVEVDSEGELERIRDFLLPRISYNQIVLTGGVRSGGSGSFINAASGTSTYTDFFSTVDPSRSHCEDCLALAFNLYGEEGIHHLDVPCDFLPLYPKWEKDHAFLCEVPERVNKTEVCQVEDNGPGLSNDTMLGNGTINLG